MRIQPSTPRTTPRVSETVSFPSMSARDFVSFVDKAADKEIVKAARPRNWVLSLAEQKTLPPWLQAQAQSLREGYAASPDIKSRTINVVAVHAKVSATILMAVQSAIAGRPVGPREVLDNPSFVEGLMKTTVTKDHVAELDKYSPGLTKYLESLLQS